MSQGTDVIWSGRPWIGPALALRTITAIMAGIIVIVALSALGMFTIIPLGVPLLVWALGLIAIIWLASMTGLLVMRASFRYVLRQSSIEVDQGIASRKSLVVSHSGFSELEVDQGIVGRMLNYGSVEVRSQGGQQLNLIRIRDPKGVSAKIREVMTVPTVRIAKDESFVSQNTK